MNYEYLMGLLRMEAQKGNEAMERLMDLLDEEGIPYRTRNNIMGGIGLEYYGTGNTRILDVISDGYGKKEGLLEAQGMSWDCVPVTVEELYHAIRTHWYEAVNASRGE